jgi:hypothetical protein
MLATDLTIYSLSSAELQHSPVLTVNINRTVFSGAAIPGRNETHKGVPVTSEVVVALVAIRSESTTLTS